MFNPTPEMKITAQRDILWGELVHSLTHGGDQSPLEGTVHRAVKVYTDFRNFPVLEDDMKDFISEAVKRVLSIKDTEPWRDPGKDQATANKIYRVVAAYAALIMKCMDAVLIKRGVQRKPKDAVIPETLDELFAAAPFMETPLDRLKRNINGELMQASGDVHAFIAEHFIVYLKDEANCYMQPEITRREVKEAVQSITDRLMDTAKKEGNPWPYEITAGLDAVMNTLDRYCMNNLDIMLDSYQGGEHRKVA